MVLIKIRSFRVASMCNEIIVREDWVKEHVISLVYSLAIVAWYLPLIKDIFNKEVNGISLLKLLKDLKQVMLAQPIVSRKVENEE